MIIFMISLLLTALYLTSPSKRKTPSKPSEFSFTDYRNRLTDYTTFDSVKSSGSSPAKRPTQAKLLPFKNPEYGKILSFRKPEAGKVLPFRKPKK